MACPVLEEPVDREAQILRRALRRERVIRARLDILSFPDDFLCERYRFSAQSISYLNNILRPYITHVTHRGHPLSSLHIICIALRFFANGSFLYNIGDAEHVSKATVCRAVRNVTVALNVSCTRLWCSPVTDPQDLSKRDATKLQGSQACIDGTHIPIIAPSVNEGDYVNRKSFHSINVQIICDAANIITNVEAKWPGSVHDSQIFRECTLSTKFGHGELRIL
ncbi:putative nuclease HARBI1 [Pundamilia nyererei]|uniref:Nuclease HARBI1 n=1 Tax=Pundamilia nyererei TaxID=303518 RepID=A0A9Y6M9F6_9CICH|nr:PREDICTED: putative nuclease HARBI1 [Pundamilia nyererei]